MATQARKRAKSSHKNRSASLAGPASGTTSNTKANEPPSPAVLSPTSQGEQPAPADEAEGGQNEQPKSGAGEELKTPTVPIPDIRIEDTSEDSKTPEAEADGPTQPTAGEEIAEHLVPSLVDTTLVRDDIVKVHYWVISHLIRDGNHVFRYRRFRVVCTTTRWSPTNHISTHGVRISNVSLDARVVAMRCSFRPNWTP